MYNQTLLIKIMKLNFLRKIGILLLTIICIHFTCYFPVVSAASDMHQMNGSMTMLHAEQYNCCEQTHGICHDIGDMSFLNFVTFKIADTNFVKYFNVDLKPAEKQIVSFHNNFFKDSQLENIKTVRIII